MPRLLQGSGDTVRAVGGGGKVDAGENHADLGRLALGELDDGLGVLDQFLLYPARDIGQLRPACQGLGHDARPLQGERQVGRAGVVSGREEGGAGVDAGDGGEVEIAETLVGLCGQAHHGPGGGGRGRHVQPAGQRRHHHRAIDRLVADDQVGHDLRALGTGPGGQRPQGTEP